MTHEHARRYSVEIFWSEEDNAFIAVVPDLPGCSSHGESRAEAAIEVEDAMICWLEACAKAGNPIPLPTTHAEEQGRYTLLDQNMELRKLVAWAAKRLASEDRDALVAKANEIFARLRVDPLACDETTR